MSKACKKCNLVKELDEFYKQKRMRDGHKNVCKVCDIKNAREWQSKHPERYRQNKSNWQRSEQGRVSAKRTRERMGVEYNRARQEAWRQANREYDLARKREYALQSGNAKRRMRERQQFIEPVDAQVVYEMHGGMCGICKGFIDLTKTGFHVDHVVPLAKGGVHGYINTQPAHPQCNLRKGVAMIGTQ